MSRPLGRALVWWDAFWFTPASAVNLAAARVVFAAHAIWILASRDLPAISGVPAAFWAAVEPGTRWRYLLFPGHATLEYALQAIALAALVAALLGVWARPACLVSGLLLYHLAPLETIYWYTNPFERGFTVTVLALVVLAASPCGDALSVRSQPVRPAPSSDYRWPLRLIQVFFCQVYFISGYAKLARAGPGWVSAENIRAWLLVFAQEDQVRVATDLGLWLAAQPVLCWLVAAGTIALDLGLITMVVWPRLRAWLVPTALAFHGGILLTMGIVFLNVPLFLIFVDWATLGERWRATRQPGPLGESVVARKGADRRGMGAATADPVTLAWRPS